MAGTTVEHWSRLEGCSFVGLLESSPSERARRFVYSATAAVCSMDDGQALEEPN